MEASGVRSSWLASATKVPHLVLARLPHGERRLDRVEQVVQRAADLAHLGVRVRVRLGHPLGDDRRRRSRAACSRRSRPRPRRGGAAAAPAGGRSAPITAREQDREQRRRRRSSDEEPGRSACTACAAATPTTSRTEVARAASTMLVVRPDDSVSCRCPGIVDRPEVAVCHRCADRRDRRAAAVECRRRWSPIDDDPLTEAPLPVELRDDRLSWSSDDGRRRSDAGSAAA